MMQRALYSDCQQTLADLFDLDDARPILVRLSENFGCVIGFRRCTAHSFKKTGVTSLDAHDAWHFFC